MRAWIAGLNKNDWNVFAPVVFTPFRSRVDDHGYHHPLQHRISNKEWLK